MNPNVKTVTPLTSRDLIRLEVERVVAKTKESLREVKRIALAEAWKTLQLTTAGVIQVIEAIGNDLSGPDKKALAMELLSSFYDSVFIVVDIPVVPNILEPIIHKHVKAILMVLVSSTIDALVTTFRNTGVFLKRGNSQV
jgi:hypothetical protein